MVAKRLRERPGDQGSGPAKRLHIIDDSSWCSSAATLTLGQGRAGLARPAEPVHVNGDMKAATCSTLRLRIDGGQLLLPTSATELLRELTLLRVDLAPSATERIEASTGHDALALALALAMAPCRDAAKRWHTLLADLADPRRRLASQRHIDLPTVKSGGGQTIPAQPVF